MISLEFNSWDEIQPGDKLELWRDGKSHGFVVIFKKNLGYPGGIRAKCIECPDNELASEYKEETSWSGHIYPYKAYHDIIYGWKKVIEELQYDPSQQGDTEDDI